MFYILLLMLILLLAQIIVRETRAILTWESSLQFPMFIFFFLPPVSALKQLQVVLGYGQVSTRGRQETA